MNPRRRMMLKNRERARRAAEAKAAEPKSETPTEPTPPLGKVAEKVAKAPTKTEAPKVAPKNKTERPKKAIKKTTQKK